MKVRKYTYDDIPQIAHIHVRTWQSSYKDILPDDYLEELSSALEAKIKHHQNQYGKHEHNHTIVVEKNNQICGFLIYGPQRNKSVEHNASAEIYALYILKEHQHKGIGHSLMEYAVSDLVKSGYEDMRIWALKDNQYRCFYDKLSGEVTEEKWIKIGEESFGEVCYYYNLIQLNKHLLL